MSPDGTVIATLDECGLAAPDIRAFLEDIDDEFDPPVSTLVDLGEWSEKLRALARVVLALDGRVIAGLAAVYANDMEGRNAYIPYLGVAPSHRGRGIARRLIERCVEEAARAGMRVVKVRTWQTNAAALRLYDSLGFERVALTDDRGNGVLSVHFAKELY